MLRQKAVDLRRNTVVYVDERGHRTKELLSGVAFRGSGSDGVLQDSVGEHFSFENENDLVMAALVVANVDWLTERA